MELKRVGRIYNSKTEPKMSDESIVKFLLGPGVLPTNVARRLYSKRPAT